MRPFTEIMRLFLDNLLNNLNGMDFFFIETTRQYWQYMYFFFIMTPLKGELSCG